MYSFATISEIFILRSNKIIKDKTKQDKIRQDIKVRRDVNILIKNKDTKFNDKTERLRHPLGS
jgi:stalled ribosome rescue protein Dom34